MKAEKLNAQQINIYHDFFKEGILLYKKVKKVSRNKDYSLLNKLLVIKFTLPLRGLFAKITYNAIKITFIVACLHTEISLSI